MKRLLTLLVCCALGVSTLSAQKVRVMSYNVKNGIGMDKVKDISRCAEVIRKVKPDVVAIQEVDSMTRRNKKDVLAELAEKSGGYHAYFGKAIDYKGGSYGVGVLSKKPALSVKTYPLPNHREARVLLVVEYEKYYMLCTHLSGVPRKLGRGVQVDIIRDVVSKLDKPVFIAGDTNARPTSAPMKAFKEFATVLSDESKMTAPSHKPSKCIDYILGAKGSFKVRRERVMYGCLYSDHLPLYVDVKILKPKRKR